MKVKLFEALKTKYSNFGFSQKTLEQVADYLGQTVTEETNIEPAVTGAEPLLKAFQGEFDKRVTEAVAKAKTEQRKPDTPPEPPKKPDEDVPAWAKTMMERLESFEKKESQVQLTAKLKAKIADRVPDSFLKGRAITITSEADIDKLATDIEADYTAMKQDMVNQGVFVESPKRSQPPGQEGVELAKRIAEQKNKGTSEGVEGKKI